MRNISYQVFEALSLLKPFDIDKRKIRIGRGRDGGYVLADLPSDCDVMSFGISGDVEFEKQMAASGHRTVYMYDHTITELPEENTAFVFNKIGICPEGHVSSDLLSLQTLIEALPTRSDRMILKIDVEGCEWDVFATMPTEVLEMFDQVIIEMHWFKNLSDPGFAQTVIRALRNINSQFTLFHVHGNNHCELHFVGGFTVADVIEVSYIRTSLIERRKSETVYPTSIDNANHSFATDIALLFYPFLPHAVSDDYITEVVKCISVEASKLEGHDTGSLSASSTRAFDMNGVWTQTTGAVSATSGTIMMATGKLRYKKFGRTVFISVEASVVTNGNGSGALLVELPFTAGAGTYVLNGRDTRVGKVLAGSIAPNSSSLAIMYYDGSYPGANGACLTLSGTYEAAALSDLAEQETLNRMCHVRMPN